MDIQALQSPPNPDTTTIDSAPPRLEATDLEQTTRGGTRILRGINLRARPGELVAVIGPSGAGKTTLLEALAGVRRTSGGLVRHDGSETAVGDRCIGYVPQDDIIHRELPLARTLRYAAKLRLSAADKWEIDRRVDDTLAVLGLAHKATTVVGSLSGGERKRASIGVELLARPRLFFLDEPTSGLDPGHGAELARLLRALTFDGATVVFTTHAPADVEGCDTVVVLTDRGRLAFAGPPEQACAYFDVPSIAGVYGRLAEGAEGNASPPESESAAGRDGAAEAEAAAGAGTAAPPGPPRPPRPPRPPVVGAARQLAVMTARNADILRRGRLTLGILLGSPLMILAMFLVLFDGGAFDPAHPSPSTTVMILFWIAFGGFFFGLTYGLLQICVELPVLRREMLAGVRPGPYILAKAALLLPLLAAVDLLLLGVLRALDRLPAVSAGTFGSLYVTLLLGSFCALTLGLLCSAAVSNPSQATLALPMLCFPQVLFVGAVLPVPLMAPVGRWLSYAMSNRWTFEALGHSAGLPRLWGSGASPLGPPLSATYGHSFDRQLWLDWVVIGAFTLIFLVGTWAILLRKSRP